jgi:uncharacterized OB-fold protein
MSGAKPLHPGLFTWPDQNPSLLGSLCLDCGEHAFPSQRSCRACSGQNTQDAELGNAGTLWTWTIQSFMPKTPYLTDETPETFRTYGVGYVELPCGLKVESRLRENTPDQLRIGMPMQLEIISVREDEKGDALMTFQFCAAKETH